MNNIRESWYTTESGETVHVRLAKPEDASLVLASDENDDGRSEFVWITLPNGDLVLATYPSGDLYELLTQDRRV